MKQLTRTILLAFAVGVISFVIVRSSAADRDPTVPAWSEAVQRRWGEIAAEGTLLGSEAAPVTVAVFSDFQCPFCAEADSVLRQAREANADAVRIRYHHMPLTAIHPYALQAAHAAECAAEQGRFDAYAKALFSRQSQIESSSWVALARAAGVPDLERFEHCHASGTHVRRIFADLERARSLKLPGTPVVVVNGEVLSRVTPQSLEEAIRRGLRSAR